MNVRLAALATAALAAAVLASPANAAGVCLQLVDDAGDGTNGALPNQNALDILSGDIATGRKNLVAALRMKSVKADPALVGGMTYKLAFASSGTPYVLTYRQFGTGEREATLTVGSGTDVTTTSVDFLVDEGTATITWIVARKNIPALKKPGAKFSQLAANSYAATNLIVASAQSRNASSADDASSGKTYVDGTTTCLKGT